MTLAFNVYWSFRSPYSYLATPRLKEIAETYDVEVTVSPVYPLAIRTPEFFETVNPLWGPYLMHDTRRIADMLGIGFSWPNPDPVQMDRETRRPAAEQPYIHRLTRLGIAAAERGRGLPFIYEVSRLIFGGEVKGWDKGDHLAQATARAGLDLAELESEVAGDPDRYDAIAARNQDDLQKAGHWGVPTMVFEGEPFFGQDRLDLLMWRLGTKGLEKR